MIDLNDPFTGVMAGLLLILAIGAYIAIFGEVKEEPRKKKG